MEEPFDPVRTRLVGPDGASLRAAFGNELDGTRRLDLAISRIRLDTLGAIPSRLRDVERTRLLLGELRAEMIDAEAHALAVRPIGRRRLRALAELLGSGKVEVRASPLAGWHPDFSIFESHDPAAARGLRALVGSHAFGRAGPIPGPLHAVRLRGPDEVGELPREFARLWSRAHEVTGALESMLRRALRWAVVPRTIAARDPGSAA